MDAFYTTCQADCLLSAHAPSHCGGLQEFTHAAELKGEKLRDDEVTSVEGGVKGSNTAQKNKM